MTVTDETFEALRAEIARLKIVEAKATHRPTKKQLRRIHATIPPILDIWRLIARRHGYALTIHGSLARDIDVVAIPWVAYDECSSPEKLVAALVACDPTLHISEDSPLEKPNGRISWSIPGYFGPGYFDLSVIRPRPEATL
jgi:hypothetical protein